MPETRPVGEFMVAEKGDHGWSIRPKEASFFAEAFVDDNDKGWLDIENCPFFDATDLRDIADFLDQLNKEK